MGSAKYASLDPLLSQSPKAKPDMLPTSLPGYLETAYTVQTWHVRFVDVKNG